MHLPLPHYVYEGMGPQDKKNPHGLARKFHFWHDILPYALWKLENKYDLRLHHGHNSSKIYKSDEGKKRLKTCFF